jgi:hypothetical protein
MGNSPPKHKNVKTPLTQVPTELSLFVMATMGKRVVVWNMFRAVVLMY